MDLEKILPPSPLRCSTIYRESHSEFLSNIYFVDLLLSSTKFWQHQLCGISEEPLLALTCKIRRMQGRRKEEKNAASQSVWEELMPNVTNITINTQILSWYRCCGSSKIFDGSGHHMNAAPLGLIMRDSEARWIRKNPNSADTVWGLTFAPVTDVKPPLFHNPMGPIIQYQVPIVQHQLSQSNCPLPTTHYRWICPRPIKCNKLPTIRYPPPRVLSKLSETAWPRHVVAMGPEAGLEPTSEKEKQCLSTFGARPCAWFALWKGSSRLHATCDNFERARTARQPSKTLSNSEDKPSETLQREHCVGNTWLSVTARFHKQIQCVRCILDRLVSGSFAIEPQTRKLGMQVHGCDSHAVGAPHLCYFHQNCKGLAGHKGIRKHTWLMEGEWNPNLILVTHMEHILGMWNAHGTHNGPPCGATRLGRQLMRSCCLIVR